jgi:hypothetical protein
VDASSFGCVVILSVYFTVNFVTYSLIVRRLKVKSVCKILFGIFHGIFTLWYLCNTAIFELLTVPQRVIAYVQLGFRIVLFIINLFSIDNSDFPPRIQYICWNFSSSCFRSANRR